MNMFGIGMMNYGATQIAVQGGGDMVDICVRCGYAGCDVRVVGCGCAMHTRCAPVPNPAPLTSCRHCNRPTNGLTVIPMSFQEMDEARKTSLALSGPGGKRGRKRKAGLPGPCGSEAEVSAIEQEKADNADRRTGRWTAEETAYVDQLIANFETGCLPLADGIKLNDFLATMLQCKQSRLTKKMKNAKLSTKAFKRTAGYIVDQNDARNVSGLEEAFFHSIICHQERAEIRFHMQKQWREFFSRFCVLHGQPLDADAWLSSVEEMERRASMAKDAARMARRKLMIGKALSQDIKNTDRGVFIERSANDMNADSVAAACASSLIAAGMPQAATGFSADSEEFLSLLTDKSIFDEKEIDKIGTKQPSKKSIVASPFLDKIMSFLQRSGIAFEHVDAWVPSFIPSPGEGDVGAGNTRTKCRLCYAGSATADVQVTANGRHEPVGNEELFNLLAFGDYSQKFSFDVGCGLPGRVYQTGIPTWEQSVHNAPLEHFERCGGAVQWGIRTVVGIPVPSPKVGRIVVTLYSCHDRQKDQELVGRLCDEFTRLLPSPKWKLVVDLGLQPPPPVAPPAPQASATPNQVGRGAAPGAYNNNGNVKDSRIFEVVSLLGEHMPSDASSPLANYLPGFMTLRLMMLRSSRTPEEEELVRTLLDSYSSYSAAGRSTADIALLLARDCMFLTQQTAVSQSQQIMPRQQQQQQQQQQPQPLSANSHFPSPQPNALNSSTLASNTSGQPLSVNPFIHQSFMNQANTTNTSGQVNPAYVPSLPSQMHILGLPAQVPGPVPQPHVTSNSSLSFDPSQLQQRMIGNVQQFKPNGVTTNRNSALVPNGRAMIPE